jgi:indolepyruvate ferredoxin oxidoreductase
MSALAPVSLDDKYTLAAGRIYLSGIQALVRLPLMQVQRDRAAGLNTGAFISGYRGSPVGGYDEALWAAERLLVEHGVRFQPGLNEDLAATAVWGSQQVNLYPGAKVDGVCGIWYGKGPGVDRSMDVIKHANAAGSSRHGGVLLVAGDDHAAQSSTLPHQSDQLLAGAMLPILNPANVQDYLDMGLYGFALSRFSGCWVGFKAISETIESSASVYVDPQRMQLVTPAFEMPPGGLNIRWPDPGVDAERRLHGPRMEAVAAFARANPIDHTGFDSPDARFGIFATGKAWLDARQALTDLGIDEARARQLGLRLRKVGLTWPLEEQGARRFAHGLRDVLVVEEKAAFVETQLVRILYNLPAGDRPSVVGKRDEEGRVLLRSEGDLSPLLVARAIVGRLARLGLADEAMRARLERLEGFERHTQALALPAVQRTPFFCSGCPHNTSTKLPEGSRGMAGIGCHIMVMWQPARRTATFSAMGGEGAAWIGQSPFSGDRHIFQNLGDGTYAHSGLLAIRAAAAAGVNITYKILYNDAVAMTGGQPSEGSFSVPQIARQVYDEGARRVTIVTDEPQKYAGVTDLPPGSTVHHRRELDTVQRELREVPGLTVLIYDQTCAAEKRRRRKRGEFPDPQRRVFINDAVCEGCGDCSVKSNCISVKPLDTELGRKRFIDQSSCNKDFSCLEGFCPSFVTVEGGGVRKARRAAAQAADPAALPEPAVPELTAPYAILVTGIGGTGVLTVGALLGMAAHLEGRGCSVLDNTGAAQKNGAVTSHVRLAPSPEQLIGQRIAAGGTDLILGCDMVVAASGPVLSTVASGRTRAVVNTRLEPTSASVIDPDLDVRADSMTVPLAAAVGADRVDFVEATRLATALMGDSIAANLFMVGYAWQKGLVPLSLAAIERAIELNAVSVEANKATLAWGRLAAHDPQRALEAAGIAPTAAAQAQPRTLVDLVERRAAMLADYQDANWAARYRALVDSTAEAERRVTRGSTALAEAVAQNFHKLMAYKDEYEVARLYTDGRFLEKLRGTFDGDFRLRFHLAPPLLSRRDPATGELVKRSYGPWMLTAMRLLARMKRLRGTTLDPFGRTAERRTERALIDEYEQTVKGLIGQLHIGNLPVAIQLARLPEEIRGFGHVKERKLAEARRQHEVLLRRFGEAK